MLRRVGGSCASGVVYHLVEIFFFPDGVKYLKVQSSGYAHDKQLLGEPFLDSNYCLSLERFVSANFFRGVSFKDLSVFFRVLFWSLCICYVDCAFFVFLFIVYFYGDLWVWNLRSGRYDYIYHTVVGLWLYHYGEHIQCAMG